MSKPKRPNLQGLIAPPPSHGHVTEQAPNEAAVQLHDDDVPDAVPAPEPAPEPIVEKAVRPQPVRVRRVRPKVVEVEPADYAHRSLYARAETLELIRQIAFREKISAQSLYREGLFLMLRKRGEFRDKQLDDV